jgi:hypothetical protein
MTGRIRDRRSATKPFEAGEAAGMSAANDNQGRTKEKPTMHSKRFEMDGFFMADPEKMVG